MHKKEKRRGHSTNIQGEEEGSHIPIPLAMHPLSLLFQNQIENCKGRRNFGRTPFGADKTGITSSPYAFLENYE
jgi:hypothetical protein